MSEVTTAPVATEAPSTEAAPAPERILQGRAALRAKLTKAGSAVLDNAVASTKFKDESPAVSSETPSPESTSVVAKLEEATGEEAPEKKQSETKVQYETRIAKLLMQVQRAESEGLKHKGALDKANAELTDLKAKFAEASSDPVKALKLAGMTPDELAQAMLDGKLTKSEEKVAKQELPPEVLELLEEAKRLKAEKVAQTEAAEAVKFREKKLEIVAKAKTGAVADFPVLELIPNDRLLDAYEMATTAGEEEPDFGEFAADLQRGLIGEIAAGVGHKATLKLILAAKPELKEFLLKELGASPAKAEDPTSIVLTPTTKSTIAGTPSETPVRKKDMSMAERKARAAQAANKVFGD